MNDECLKDYRCPHDDKLLFKGMLVDSVIEVKCRGCGNIVELIGESSDKLICKKVGCPNRV